MPVTDRTMYATSAKISRVTRRTKNRMNPRMVDMVLLLVDMVGLDVAKDLALSEEVVNIKRNDPEKSDRKGHESDDRKI